MLCLILLVLILLIGLVCQNTAQQKDQSSCFPMTKRTALPVYFINRDAHTERRRKTEAHLNSLGFKYRRIRAIEPDSSEYNVVMLEQPCKKNTPTQIAVILSHLKAIYTAVHDPIPPTSQNDKLLSNYALIMEDDVKLLYDVDFAEMINTAPRKFGTLQLVTSNPEAVDSLWYEFNTFRCSNTSTAANEGKEELNEGVLGTAATTSTAHQRACVDYPSLQQAYQPKPIPQKKKKSTGWNEDDYIAPPPQPVVPPVHRAHDLYASQHWKPNHWNDFSRNGKTALYWSEQAYIINRRVAWKFLHDIIETNSTSPRNGSFAASVPPMLGFKIVNSFTAHACQRRPQRPCVLSSCLYSYAYIMSAGQPTHTSMIPLFASTKLGLNSTLHPEQWAEFKRAFSKIRAISAQLRGEKQALLPRYLNISADSRCQSRSQQQHQRPVRR